MPTPGGRGQGLEKWDILSAVLGSCLWPEGDSPKLDMEEGSRGDFWALCYLLLGDESVVEAGGDGWPGWKLCT